MGYPEKLATRRRQALIQTTGGKDEPNIFFVAEIVTDITTWNPERKDT